MINNIIIPIICWKRPFQLFFTLFFLNLYFIQNKIDYKIFLFQQGNNLTIKFVLFLFKRRIFYYYNSSHNIGIVKAKKILAENILLNNFHHETIVLQLEDDWLLCNYNKWLLDSLKLLNQNSNIQYIKLRVNFDQDDFSSSNYLISPWNFENLDIKYYIHSIENTLFYILKSKNTGFTFNPLIMRLKFFFLVNSNISEENVEGLSIERSGERDIDEWVRNFNCEAAVLCSGAFRHLGSPGLRSKIIYIPFRIIKNFITVIISIFKNDY